jgi:peptidyl-prolyl cis-trans isomerase D
MSENMADKMKRKLVAKKATAWIVFGAIILVFVFFGLPGKQGAGVGSVARVNNSLIAMSDFQQEETKILQYYQKMMGTSVDLSSQRQLLQQQAIETLVRNELVSQAAKNEGILATDSEVRDFIVSEPSFQQNGQFEKDFYFRYLEAAHLTAGQLEGRLRKDISNIRLRHLFELVGRPSDLEIKKSQELRSHKLNVFFVKIDQESIVKSMTKGKAEAALKSLDDALNKGDESAVNAQLKEMKATWEETGLVDFAADSFPKISSAVATEAIFELSKSQPLLKRLVRDGNFKYVLKFKDFKVMDLASLDVKTIEMMQKRHGDALFEKWLNNFRAKSYVSMNPQALKMQ